MMQLTDEQYYNLADESYYDENLELGRPITAIDGTEWIVINAVNDPSGLQAIAVVPAEIDEILDEMFPYKVNGIYAVHNPEAGENIDLYTGIAKEKIYQFSEQLKKAADIAENSDKGVAKGIDTDIHWFNSLDVRPENRGKDLSGNRPIRS